MSDNLHVLITGAAGMIGQKLLAKLVREPRLGPLVPHPVHAVRRLGKWATPSARKLPAAA